MRIFKINARVCLSRFSRFSVSGVGRGGNETELCEAQIFGSRQLPAEECLTGIGEHAVLYSNKI